MSSKKLSKKQKNERRLIEAAKAQISGGSIYKPENKAIKEDTNEQPTVKSGYHELPLKEIKKDMIKNFAYLGFAIAVIVGLHLSGIDFAKFLSLRL